MRKDRPNIDLIDAIADYTNRQDVFHICDGYIKSPDGLLNLLSKRDKFKERIATDFKQAASRMAQAAVGLDQIYGYAVVLPQLNAKANMNDPDALPFNRAVTWVRDAISWLIAFGQKDQAFTRRISL